MYAIIETGGKQYRVTPGDVIEFERLPGNKGENITLDKVLLISGKDKTLVGRPYLSSAKLQAEIVEQDYKGEKLLTIKYIRRKQYRRTIGHRQMFTRVLVTKLEDGQGGNLDFDTAKRAEILTKASVKFSTRQADHQAKHMSAAGSEKPAKKVTAKKTTETKKAAPARKSSAPKKRS